MKPLNPLMIFLGSTFLLQPQSLDLFCKFDSNIEEKKVFRSYSSLLEDGRSARTNELPVIYKSFMVKRLRTKVDLVWETSFECGNSGFEIQRKTGDGQWQKVAFVFSQALEGISNAVLTYEYTDVNIGKEESQYRLQQVDKDRQASFSEVRSIKGYY